MNVRTINCSSTGHAIKIWILLRGREFPSLMEAIAILLNPNIDRWGKLRKPVDLLSWCLKFIENCISPAENVRKIF